MKKAALICVTRNNAEKLQTTLNSIIRNTNPEHYDLFIIDNASSDSTLGIYQLPTLADNITIVRSGKNLNWVGGINLGLEMTKGYQYVGFLNDDIEVCPNWLENFFDVLDCNPDVAAVGPITSNTIDWQGYDNLRFLFEHWNLPEIPEIDRKDMVSMYAHIKNNGSGIPLDWAISLFCILFKRKAFEESGVLNNECFKKIRSKGRSFALSTKTYVICNHGKVRFKHESESAHKDLCDYKNLKTWVINLERRSDRLEKFKNNHPEICNELNVLKAHDGRNLRLTPKIARLVAPNRFGWHKGKIGCCLSHIELWNKLCLEENDDAVYLILEDDVILDKEWKEKVVSAFQHNDVPANWDVVYLGGNPLLNGNLRPLAEIVSGDIYKIMENNLWQQDPPDSYCHFGAYAYLINKKGARKTIELIQQLGNGIWQELDHMLANVRSGVSSHKRHLFFFHPQIASYYQYDNSSEPKLFYNEADQISFNSNNTTIDSDVLKASGCFSEEEAKPMIFKADPCDVYGALQDVKRQSVIPFETQNIKISLLHATRGRPNQAINAKELWLNTAKYPGRVEHIFAIDHDDEESIALKMHDHVIQFDDGHSVGAWNLAAASSSGDILIQLSDDWLPPEGWDELICRRLNCNNEEVLRVSDGYRKDDLMCMAILTREYYVRHGLFDPAFKNVYSDDDYTRRATKLGVVVDARDIVIRHEHPAWGTGKPMDATYERGNQSAEYERAKAIFEAKHFPTIYSQNDEQVVIERFFGSAPGVLWDFGCNDGVTFSNSHHMLKNRGWKGVLVDASPVCVDKAKILYSDRQDIQILNLGLGEGNGILDFYESGTHLGQGDLSLVSSFKKESTQRWEPTTEYQVKQIQVCDFKTFLDDHALYKTADFITIDIEGLDFEILSSIDLNQTQTRLVCVEHNGHDIQKYIDYCRKFGMGVISQNAENLLMGKN